MTLSDPVVISAFGSVVAGLIWMFKRDIARTEKHIKECDADRKELRHELEQAKETQIGHIQRTARLEALLGLAGEKCPVKDCPKKELLKSTSAYSLRHQKHD
ncbi:hypothetical protein Rhal01_03432 [Rubritalea halochordaticola]|uniref:Holin n=1 Tax=Rubritalea halochordaticola TaxID=714537 RepID=A0ABP9V6S6_9BACT